MKMNLALPSLMLLLSFQANAANEPVLVQKSTRKVEVTLNQDTVKCLVGDYGASALKVLIPELADMTVLNHRVPGSNAPCVTAGFCRPGGFSVKDIIDPNKPIETVDVEVSVLRHSQWDEQKQTCRTTMSEIVNTKIRGIEFSHMRMIPIENGSLWGSTPRPKEDCI